MKVKIGNKIYNSDEEPIMVTLEDSDKRNFMNMLDNGIICVFPLNYNKNDIIKFMNSEILNKEVDNYGD